MWTDETKIETGERPGRKQVTRNPGEEFLPENIVPTFKSGRQGIMVWACVGQGFKGPIVKVDLVPETTTKTGRKRGGGLDTKTYINQVMKGPLKEALDSFKVLRGSGTLVVEDGAPCHTSKAAKATRSELGITPLTHPPSSPDLNPIEPIWLVLKNRVADIPGSSNSLTALWNAIQKAWDEITLEEIDKYTCNMEERVQAVKAAKGGHTRF